jgi:hypothetical protein
MSSTYIRSADETHQVHVSYTPKQFGRIYGRLAWGSPHRALIGRRRDGDFLPVVECPDLDAWLDEQHAELKRQHEAVLAEVAALRAQPIREAA